MGKIISYNKIIFMTQYIQIKKRSKKIFEITYSELKSLSFLNIN